MAKRRQPKREADQSETLSLLELRCGIIQHCAALKAVASFLSENKREAAVARLDQAIAALHALVRGECTGMTMNCPNCGEAENVVAWVDSGLCSHCGGKLEIPGKEQG
jgi:hypothetical protein